MSYGGDEPYGEYNCDELEEVNKVLYCVTPTKEVTEYFKANNYDLLISHHPYRADVPQLIFHTAFDCCTNGLNDIMASHLGVEGEPFDEELGICGNLPTPLTITQLTDKIKELTGSVDGQVFDTCSGDLIHSVAICTGLGG